MTHEQANPFSQPPQMHEQVAASEIVALQRGQDVELATAHTLYNPAEIGIPEVSAGNRFSVVGEIALPGQGGDGSDDAETALVRMDTQHGMSELFLVGLMRDAQGNRVVVPGKSWVTLKEGVGFVVGRGDGTDDARLLDGARLFGTDMPDTVSRRHATIKYEHGTVTIHDTSSNGTIVKGERPQPAERSATRVVSKLAVGHVASVGQVRASGAAMIDSADVPRTPQDMDRIAADREASRQAEIKAQLAEVDQELEALKQGLSERDSIALWKYASGIINKREAQQRGDGQDSYNQERLAGEGLREMSPKAREIKDDYRWLMERNSRLLDQLK
jgi:pSer/pThr/pTyr-binding forkhead associated (FHA) protein